MRDKLAHFESCPITGIHLWFDRQITDLDHAVLLDRTIQWMFNKTRLLTARGSSTDSAGSYIELVVSASKSLIDKSRGEIVDLVLKEVREFFPAARHANLLKSTVIKEVHATYSPRLVLTPTGRSKPPHGRGSSSPVTGPPPVGPPPWKAPSAAAIWRPKRSSRSERCPLSLVAPDWSASGLMRVF